MHCLQAKTNMFVDFYLRGQQEMDFFSEGSLIIYYEHFVMFLSVMTAPIHCRGAKLSALVSKCK